MPIEQPRVVAAPVIAAIVLMIVASARTVIAAIDLFTIDGSPVVLSAAEQSREEVWNWFPASTPNLANRYAFLGSWIRVGAGYERDGVTIFGELMSPFFVNLPDNAIAPAPQGPLGLGANYYQRYEEPNNASVFLKQGYLEFGRELLDGFDVKGGRFEFFDGLEFMPKDLSSQLTWLINNRIAQRLVANFGFSDIMRSFDGAVVSYGNEAWQATAMYGVPTKGVFDLNGNDEIRKTDLAYGSWNAGPELNSSEWWGNSTARLFYIYYSDTRGLPLVDNTGNTDTRPVSIDTIGGDYVRTQAVGTGTADFLLWGARQFGAWGKLSQNSYAFVAEGGYRLTSVAWKPWMRLGYTVSSGDGNSKDGTHGTFFQILPTPRIYAMTPFYNMMNIDDAMAQVIVDPVSGLELQSDLHALWLDSREDLWYTGGGAYDNAFFGYTGRPSGGHSYLGTLADCQVTWKINAHVTSQVYYGHVFGGDVIGSVYEKGREAEFGYIQVTFSL